jgi:hypothetical protein
LTVVRMPKAMECDRDRLGVVNKSTLFHSHILQKEMMAAFQAGVDSIIVNSQNSE